MYDLDETKKYWSRQTKKGDSPCHYHNKWQDAYAFRIRMGAFRSSDFDGINTVVDVGCGIGEYMAALAEKAPHTDFIGFDFPFNIDIAQHKYAGNNRLVFYGKPLPSQEVLDAISRANAVVMTTVYVHLAVEARQSFLNALATMRVGSKVLLLEYAPDTVPGFQKRLAHKEVEIPSEIIRKIGEQGFEHLETRAVNYMDSFLFFHLGKNRVAYYLTLVVEEFLKFISFPRSKYKLFIFKKQ